MLKQGAAHFPDLCFGPGGWPSIDPLFSEEEGRGGGSNPQWLSGSGSGPRAHCPSPSPGALACRPTRSSSSSASPTRTSTPTSPKAPPPRGSLRTTPLRRFCWPGSEASFFFGSVRRPKKVLNCLSIFLKPYFGPGGLKIGVKYLKLCIFYFHMCKIRIQHRRGGLPLEHWPLAAVAYHKTVPPQIPKKTNHLTPAATTAPPSQKCASANSYKTFGTRRHHRPTVDRPRGAPPVPSSPPHRPPSTDPAATRTRHSLGVLLVSNLFHPPSITGQEARLLRATFGPLGALGKPMVGDQPHHCRQH